MRRLLILLWCFSLPAFSDTDGCTPSAPEGFGGFFSNFSKDRAFALRRTIYPLSVVQWHHGMDGNDVAPPEHSMRDETQDQGTPSLSAFMRGNGLTSNILDANSKAAIVEVSREGTSWVMTYHFLRKGGCWFLREFQDHSSSNFR